MIVETGLLVADDIALGENDLYLGKLKRSPVIPGAYEAEVILPIISARTATGCTSRQRPCATARGRLVGTIETLRDVSERRNAERAAQGA